VLDVPALRAPSSAPRIRPRPGRPWRAGPTRSRASGPAAGRRAWAPWIVMTSHSRAREVDPCRRHRRTSNVRRCLLW